MRRLLLLLLIASPGLSACGEKEEPAVPATPAGHTRLEVVVRPDGPGGPVRRRVVTDVPPQVTAGDFAPVPANVACTEIYGGPATATVTGKLDGRPVDARFNRTDGCEIARWEALEPLLGDVPGAAGP